MKPMDFNPGSVLRYTAADGRWREIEVLPFATYTNLRGGDRTGTKENYPRVYFSMGGRADWADGWVLVPPAAPAATPVAGRTEKSAWAGVPGRFVGMMFIPQGDCVCGCPRERCPYHREERPKF